MMKKTILLFLPVLMLITSISYGQDSLSISESRKKVLKKVLDYRFKGGYYSFEKLFNTTVEYPEIAMYNCTMGIVIASFKVNCDGTTDKVTLKNSLGFAIEAEIEKFFNASFGQWNKCDDEKYTKFDVPIQFRIRGVETNSTDALLIKEDKVVDAKCHDDSYYLEKVNKYFDKGKGEKAAENIDILIRRNPYNNEYYEMKKKALSLD